MSVRRPRGVSKGGWWLAKRSLLAANAAVLILVGWGFTGEYLRHRRLQAEIDRLTAQADQLESRNFESAKLGQRFADDEAMEREARTKLGLRKPGESVIIVKDTQASEPPSSEADGQQAIAPQTPLGNLRLWWKYFFGGPDNT